MATQLFRWMVLKIFLYSSCSSCSCSCSISSSSSSKATSACTVLVVAKVGAEFSFPPESSLLLLCFSPFRRRQFSWISDSSEIFMEKHIPKCVTDWQQNFSNFYLMCNKFRCNIHKNVCAMSVLILRMRTFGRIFAWHLRRYTWSCPMSEWAIDFCEN